jgi:hypothetical protein
MKTTLMALACAAMLAACSSYSQGPSTGASGQVGGGSSVGQGPIGSTSSSSILMERIKQGDSGQYPGLRGGD